MRDPQFPRKHFFSQRLFSGESPWNVKPTGDRPAKESTQQTLVTHLVLSQFSRMRLLDRKLSVSGSANASLMLDESNRKELPDVQTLVIDGKKRIVYPGGPAQFAQFGVGDYSFPIYDVKADGSQGTGDVVIRNYDGKTSWQPNWANSTSPNSSGSDYWVAHDVPYPPGEFVTGGGDPPREADGNLVLIDEASGQLIDFWQATNCRDAKERSLGAGHNGRWQGDGAVKAEAGAVSGFKLDGLGARRGVTPDDDVWGGIRASGLPLLGGCLLPEDFRDGKSSVIEHAFAFALPRLRLFPSYGVGWNPENPPYNFVAPATRTEWFDGLENANALAAGQRIRLRDPIRFWDGQELAIKDIERPITRIVLTALRDYGAYLVDGSGGFTFYAEHMATGVISDSAALELSGTTEAERKEREESFGSETNWEYLISEFNDDLSWRLFQNAGGIPFGYMYESNKELHFESNFEVVENFAWPLSHA